MDAPGVGLTRALAERAAALCFADLPADVRRLVGHCALDWLGVTLAAREEPAVRLLLAAEAPVGGPATVLGAGATAPAAQAALINGTASHALDYDDVNLAFTGHPSVAILPGLLALAQEHRLPGERVATAFVAGYELACRIGLCLGADHYDRGFHATATVGAFGAAAAAANLLGLDGAATAQALGIAGTSAAGLKSMFGTMCKPLHAGRAAQAGVLAAKLAQAGFTSRDDVLECAQGFAATHSATFRPGAALADPPSGFFLRDTLFKFHAACYLTHSTIEAAQTVRAQPGFDHEHVEAVVVRVDRACDRVCNIAAPRTGLEAKFSLRLNAALGLAGHDTAALGAYADAVATDPALCALRDRVRVELADGWPNTRAALTVRLTDGRELSAGHDSCLPERDLDRQDARLRVKFRSLAEPVIGPARAEAAAARALALPGLPDVGAMLAPCT